MAQKKKPIQRSLEGIPNHVPFELWFMILGVYDYIFLQRFRLINKAYKQLVESYQPHHLQLFLTENTFNTLKRIKNTYQEVFRELRTVAFMLPKDNIKLDAIFTNICSQFEDCKKLEKVYTPLMNVSVSLPAKIVSAEFMLKFNVQQSLESPSALIQWLRNPPIIDWGDLLYVLEKYVQRGTYLGSPAQLGSILENLVQKWNCPMDIIDLFVELGADVHINTLAELYKGKKLSLNKFQRLIQKYKQKLLVDRVTKESLLSLISRKDDGNNLCHWIFKYSSAYLEEIMEGLGKDISTDLNKVNIHEVAPVFYLFTQPSISSTAFLKLKSLDLDLDSKITRKAILTDPQFEKSDLRKFCKLHTKKKKLSLFQIIISMTNWTKIVEQHLPNDPSLLTNQKNLIFWTCSRHKSLWPQSWSTNPQFQTLIDLHDVVFGRRDLASVINPQPVFMEAGKYGLYPIVKDFVNRRNGDINLKRRDQTGNTILHLLAKTQPHNSEFLLPLKQILRFLTTKGAPDVKNNDGLSFKDILQTRLNSSTVPII